MNRVIELLEQVITELKAANTLAERVAALETLSKAVDGPKFKDLESWLSELTERVDAAEKRTLNNAVVFESRISSLENQSPENQFSELESRLDKVEDQISEVEDSLSQLDSKVDDIPDVSDLENRIDELEGYDVNDIQSRVEDLEGLKDELDVEEVRGRVTALEAIVHEVQNEASTIKRAYASITSSDERDLAKI